jgi:Zn-dependent protease
MSAEAATVRMPPPRGAMRVATAFGIDVHLHWAWLLVAVLMIQARSEAYSGLFWNVAEYVALFGIVLLHEFGHALACKSVKGRADHILLWPLGGVAYVRPPQRPGPTLWVSAAGPLVNVVLLPITIVAAVLIHRSAPDTDIANLFEAIAVINGIVLVFNCLPVYPLDGGQMLRSVLWFVVGPHKSLIAATVVGLLGSMAFLALAFTIGDWWLVIIAAFSLMSSWSGFKVARARMNAARLPRRVTHRCPSCREAPPLGPCWPCPACRGAYDAFESGATCPRCEWVSEAVTCPFCGDGFPAPAFVPEGVANLRAAETLDPASYDVR